MARSKMYLVQIRPIKLFCLLMYIVFLNIDTFSWIVLMLHPGHTNLFLETVTVKSMGMRVAGAQGCRPIMGGEDRGPRKTNTSKANVI